MKAGYQLRLVGNAGQHTGKQTVTLVPSVQFLCSLSAAVWVCEMKPKDPENQHRPIDALAPWRGIESAALPVRPQCKPYHHCSHPPKERRTICLSRFQELCRILLLDFRSNCVLPQAFCFRIVASQWVLLWSSEVKCKYIKISSHNTGEVNYKPCSTICTTRYFPMLQRNTVAPCCTA